MAKKLAEYLDFIPYKNWTITLIVINSLSILMVFGARNILPPIVPLFYGKPYGAEQLASQTLLPLPPAIALVICLINTAINYFVKDDFLRKVLLGGMVTATLLGIITVIKIIFLVGNI